LTPDNDKSLEFIYLGFHRQIPESAYEKTFQVGILFRTATPSRQHAGYGTHSITRLLRDAAELACLKVRIELPMNFEEGKD
jgi:hypothetical protein